MLPTSVPSGGMTRSSPSTETGKVKLIDEALSILDGETNFVKTTSEPLENSSRQAAISTTMSHTHPNFTTQFFMSSGGDLLRSFEISQGLDGSLGLGSSDASTWHYDQRAYQARSAGFYSHNQVMSAHLMSAASSMAEPRVVATPAHPSAPQIHHYDDNVSTDDPMPWDFQNDLYSQPITDPGLANACGQLAGTSGTSIFIDNNMNYFDFEVGGVALSGEPGFADSAFEDAWRSIMEDSQFVSTE